MTYATFEDMILLKARMTRIGYVYTQEAITGSEQAVEAFQIMNEMIAMLGEDIRYGSRLQEPTVKTILYMIDLVEGYNKIPYTLPHAIMAILNYL